MAAQYRIEQLPLALLMKIASPDAPLRVEGTIAGNGDIRRDAAGAFNGQAECTATSADTSLATAQSAQDSQLQKASWSSACAEQRAKGRAVVKVFVNQTGMWRLIRSDTRYWEKYWEDPEMTGRENVSQ